MYTTLVLRGILAFFISSFFIFCFPSFFFLIFSSFFKFLPPATACTDPLKCPPCLVLCGEYYHLKSGLQYNNKSVSKSYITVKCKALRVANDSCVYAVQQKKGGGGVADRSLEPYTNSSTKMDIIKPTVIITHTHTYTQID